jgi:hypothetical protein
MGCGRGGAHRERQEAHLIQIWQQAMHSDDRPRTNGRAGGPWESSKRGGIGRGEEDSPKDARQLAGRNRGEKGGEVGGGGSVQSEGRGGSGRVAHGAQGMTGASGGGGVWARHGTE